MLLLRLKIGYWGFLAPATDYAKYFLLLLLYCSTARRNG